MYESNDTEKVVGEVPLIRKVAGEAVPISAQAGMKEADKIGMFLKVNDLACAFWLCPEDTKVNVFRFLQYTDVSPL